MLSVVLQGKTTHSTIIYQYHLSHILSIVFFNFSILKKTLFTRRKGQPKDFFLNIYKVKPKEKESSQKIWSCASSPVDLPEPWQPVELREEKMVNKEDGKYEQVDFNIKNIYF